MRDCIFCQIISGKAKAEVLYQDKEITVFEDIAPKAPVHFLVIPNQHIQTLNDTLDEQAALLGRLILKAKDIAKEKGIAKEGYRLVFNCNRSAGQEIFHLHLHVLGGRSLLWPPG
jgi:histidine triad (HIT) family protein